MNPPKLFGPYQQRELTAEASKQLQLIVTVACRDAIHRLYLRYKDAGSDLILAEGIAQLCEDLGGLWAAWHKGLCMLCGDRLCACSEPCISPSGRFLLEL